VILELDLGNTRGKWRTITDGGEVIDRGTGSIDAWIAGELPSVWAGAERVRVASVLSESTNALLADRVNAALGLRIEFATSSSSCAGVQNAYVEPARLGVDRWLALIAAFQSMRSAVLVVDAGSALTVDVADDNGRHLGGYIVPGARLMERSLLEGTDKVRFDVSASESFGLGVSTGECVHHGILAAQCGTVLVALHAAERQLGRRPPLIVSGGWALQAADHLAQLGVEEINVIPDLVLDGLRWALPG
jgi:type III pantothenate kinase